MRPLLLCALLLAPFRAAAQTGIGNLPPDFYPQPPCEKPDKARIGKSPGMGDQGAMLVYNFKVQNFNKQAAAFNVCMKGYTDRSQHDIDVILAAVHAAVAAANAPP